MLIFIYKIINKIINKLITKIINKIKIKNKKKCFVIKLFLNYIKLLRKIYKFLYYNLRFKYQLLIINLINN
jgi:hypothetical protein